MFNEKTIEIHEDNVNKGFYDDYRVLITTINTEKPELSKALSQTFDAQRIALIQSEASEALEANRKGKFCVLSEDSRKIILDASDEDFKRTFENGIKDTEEDEIADTLIRLFDYAGFKGIDLDFHIAAKLRYNRMRAYKHGKTM